MRITKELAEELNPEGKKLTTVQWDARIKKYEDKLAKQQSFVETPGERPGVCSCGKGAFCLEVVPGAGKMKRICKHCGKTKLV